MLLAFRQPHAAPLPQDAPAGGDPVIVAAGDIAKCNREEDGLTGYLLDTIPGTILGLGDNAQVAGSLQEFLECYAPNWGRHLDRIKPVPGNHEYLTGGASGYFSYFGDVATPLDPGCRKECGGYYSFNVGTWHIVALNSEIATEAGSPQEQWLRADLAANPTLCTLAYWHRPRWSSGRHLSGGAQGLYQALYDYGADVVLGSRS
ncbi:MAG: metallophosphoesterase [Anaerolineales bacterium]|nr:metallophosphoesterase [Anaerolineales bacterium]